MSKHTGGFLFPESPEPSSDELWVVGSGLRVTLQSAPGYTDKKLLKAPFRFQVPPLEEYTQQFAFDHAEYTTLKNGTFTRKTGRQLRQIQFQTLFLDYSVSWEAWRNPAVDPLEAAETLKGLVLTGTPFQLLVSNSQLWGEKQDTNMLAVLKALTVTEKAGEPDARYFDVSFQEWRAPAIIKRKQLGKKTKGGQQRPARSKPKTPAYLWVRADGSAKHRSKSWTAARPVTLNGLSIYFYGRSAHWRTIASANNIKGVASKDNLGVYVRRIAGVNGKANFVIPRVDLSGGS